MAGETKLTIFFIVRLIAHPRNALYGLRDLCLILG